MLGQLVIKVWLEPLQELRRCISYISECLAKHSGSIVSLSAAPPEVKDGISRDTAAMAVRLAGRRELIPMYWLVRRAYSLPSQKKISAAIGSLNLISNYVAGTHKNASVIASYGVQEVREALGLEIPQGTRLDPSRKLDFIRDDS